MECRKRLGEREPSRVGWGTPEQTETKYNDTCVRRCYDETHQLYANLITESKKNRG